jgi:hypothetical protein
MGSIFFGKITKKKSSRVIRKIIFFLPMVICFKEKAIMLEAWSK